MSSSRLKNQSYKKDTTLDILLIGEKSDKLLQLLSDELIHSGYKIDFLNYFKASQLFTITFDKTISVFPDIPIFIRYSSFQPQRSDYDTTFHYRECLTTLWTVCFLVNSTCINRPTKQDFLGNFKFSTALNEILASGTCRSREIYSDTSLALENTSTMGWSIKELGSEETSLYPDYYDSGPFMHKWTYLNLVYEMVVVVGNLSWRLSKERLSITNLEIDSIKICRNLNLQFGIVIWAISPDKKDAILVKINPFPSIYEIRPVWPEVSRSLIKLLLP